MQNVNTYVPLYLKGVTDITKYPKWSKITNFCDRHSDIRDFLDFLIFSPECMSWNVVQTNFKFLKGRKIFHQHLKLNQQHWIFIWKLTQKILSFFSVRSLRQSYHTDYVLLSFILLLKMSHFSSKMSLRLDWPCLWE